MIAARSSRPLVPSAWSVSPRVLLLASASLAAAAHAQKPCTPSDLDVTFRFGNYAPSSYIVVAVARNASDHSCVLQAAQPPAFYVAGEPKPLDIRVVPDTAHPQAITLDPSFTAHQTLRWSTLNSDGATKCVKPAVMNLPIAADTARPAQIAAASLLSPICSQVAFGTYATSPVFGDDDPAPSSSTDTQLSLLSGLSAYHPGEAFILHAERRTSMPAAGVRGFPCAKFIVRQRASDGSTRLEEIRGSQVHCGSQFQPGLSPTMTATFNAVQPVRPDALGETTVQLLELSSALDAPEISFTQSNTITLHVTADIPASTPVDTLPVYDGWKSVFTLLDSSFGKQSVLLDQSHTPGVAAPQRDPQQVAGRPPPRHAAPQGAGWLALCHRR